MNIDKHIKDLQDNLDYWIGERLKIKHIESPKTRICYQCSIEKSLKEFHKNKNRYLCRDYICKDCVSRYQKLRYRENKSKQRKGESMQLRPQQMMSNQAFSLFYNRQDIREAVEKISIRYSKSNREYQKDLQQYAWARIAMCQSGYNDEYYIKEAERAVRKDYKRNLEMRKYNLSYEETMDKTEWTIWTNGYIA